MPFWAKDIKVGFSNINAMAETVDTKPALPAGVIPYGLAEARILLPHIAESSFAYVQLISC